MSLGAIFDLAGSGMTAQSVRLNTTASNLANAQAASGSADQVYKARHPVFQTIQRQAMSDQAGFGSAGVPSVMDDASAGVKVAGIVESEAPTQSRYEPNHPQANEDGYVFYPNVNVVAEMTNMVSASRSYQMNVEVMQAAKSMMQRVLTLGQ